jgi:hypothetical protein
MGRNLCVVYESASLGSTDIVICNHEAGWVFSSGTRLPIPVSIATASMGDIRSGEVWLVFDIVNHHIARNSLLGFPDVWIHLASMASFLIAMSFTVAMCKARVIGAGQL